MKCFYHADLDGRCAGAIVKRRYPGTELYEIDYDESEKVIRESNIQPSEEIFIVDFHVESLDLFREIQETTNKIHWVDHHTTALDLYEELEDDIWGLRADTSPSGAFLTWIYLNMKDTQGNKFFKKTNNRYENIDFPERFIADIPKVVRIVSDYDTWRWMFGTSTEHFVYGMYAEDDSPSSSIWNDLIGIASEHYKNLVKIQENGAIIRKAIENRNEKYVEATGFETELDGYSCFVSNKALANSSLFDSVKRDKDYDIFATFFFTGDVWVMSIYSDKKDIDVSEIASKMGGGGHPNAAGFNSKTCPFTQ